MQIVSKEESICMKYQMLSPWENKKEIFQNMIWWNFYTAHLFDVCKKFNTVGLKGQGFSQTL